MLMHHAEPRVDRVTWTVKANRLASNANSTFVLVVETEENVHQRRLAGSVFSEERVDLTAFDQKIDAVIRNDPWKTLDDAMHFHRHRRRLTWRSVR